MVLFTRDEFSSNIITELVYNKRFLNNGIIQRFFEFGISSLYSYSFRIVILDNILGLDTWMFL